MEIVRVRDPGPKRGSRRLGRLRSSLPKSLKRPHDSADDTVRPKKRKKTSSRQIGTGTNLISNSEDLPWRSIDRPYEAGLGDFDDEGGVLMLEEVDDVDVVYEDGPSGSRVVKFKVSDKKDKKDNAGPSVSHAEGQRSAEIVEEGMAQEERLKAIQAPFDDSLLPEWSGLELSNPIRRSLHALKFSRPTEIQRRALPFGNTGRDVIGVAETGSGKTLAYGLPILNYLLSKYASTGSIPAKRRLSALVLTPTRELALQVADHLRAIVDQFDVGPERAETQDSLADGRQGPSSSGPPLISIGAVVGGMSDLKQKRIISRGMDVMIATPGRLWDLLSENDDLALQVRDISFAVLDEADRMIEAGHFEELDNILRLTRRHVEETADESAAVAFNTAGIALSKSDGSTNESMQTFVFSATLSKDLQQNLKKRKSRPAQMKKGGKAPSTLDELLMRLDFRDQAPEIIDLTTEQRVAHTLQESKLDCVSSEKDLYLYYFLLRYPGRSLVFVGSIDSIRRLVPLLQLLGLNAYPLHSHLQQKQRLKNLERFKSSKTAVLVATDVAARGLDIPAVEHVIHYQIPRTADSYIHRSGRTARAENPGFSLQLCSPDEKKVQRALMQKLGRSVDPPELPIEHGVLDKLKERIALAKKIDDVQHRMEKATHEKNWLKEAADALDVELDSDTSENGLKSQDKHAAAQIAAYKAELQELISERLMVKGISVRYVTSGSHPIAYDLLGESHHEKLVGVTKSAARDDVVKHAGKPIRNRTR